MDTVTETKLGVAAWLESSKNELEMANYSLSEKSDILEKEKKVKYLVIIFLYKFILILKYRIWKDTWQKCKSTGRTRNHKYNLRKQR